MTKSERFQMVQAEAKYYSKNKSVMKKMHDAVSMKGIRLCNQCPDGCEFCAASQSE